MSERNETMAAMLMSDAPAAHDMAFDIAVLARMERRRFHRAVMARLALALAAGVLLALVMPPLAPLWQVSLAAGARILPSGLPPHLVLGLVVTAAFLALPWWRRGIER